MDGQFIIILLGLPVVFYALKAFRDSKLDSLMGYTNDRIFSDIDALNQISTIQEWLRDTEGNLSINKEMKAKGLINLHIEECSNEDCVCRNIEDLYDLQKERYLSNDINEYHLNQTFVNHFNNQLYKESLNKFINSAKIHISYGFYLFS